MNKVRARFVVEHDLDMVPGFNFNPADMAENVRDDLWGSVPHYRPLVKCPDIDVRINRNIMRKLSDKELVIEVRKALLSPTGSAIFASHFDSDNPFTRGLTEQKQLRWMIDYRKEVVLSLTVWRRTIRDHYGIPSFVYQPKSEGLALDLEEVGVEWVKIDTDDANRSVFRSRKTYGVDLTFHHQVLDSGKFSVVAILTTPKNGIKVRGPFEIQHEDKYDIGREKIDSEVLELLKEV